MTTLEKVILDCPVCQNRFQSQAVVSTNSFGGKRTDFHEHALGAQPLPHMVHMCPVCNFCATESVFCADAELPPTMRAFLDNEVAPRLTTGAGSKKYEAAARIAEWLGADKEHLADIWLRAAWCAVDEGDAEAERYYRIRAALGIEEALAQFDGVEQSQRAIRTYLVGELYRRIGNVNAAREWFNRVRHEIDDPETQAWVLMAANQQRDRPREWFGESPVSLA